MAELISVELKKENYDSVLTLVESLRDISELILTGFKLSKLKLKAQKKSVGFG